MKCTRLRFRPLLKKNVLWTGYLQRHLIIEREILMRRQRLRRNIHDDQYTNLALLISDQCQHTIKIIRYSPVLK